MLWDRVWWMIFGWVNLTFLSLSVMRYFNMCRFTFFCRFNFRRSEVLSINFKHDGILWFSILYFGPLKKLGNREVRKYIAWYWVCYFILFLSSQKWRLEIRRWAIPMQNRKKSKMKRERQQQKKNIALIGCTMR